MSEFTFSPAAEEYAHSYEIVRAVRSEFERDVAKYFSELRRSIQKQALPAPLKEVARYDQYGALRYWRLTTERGIANGRLHIWFYPYRPGVIVGGYLTFTVGTSEKDLDWLAAVQALQNDPRFAPYVQPSSGEWWKVFSLKINAQPENIVSTPASVLGQLLTELWQIDQSWTGPHRTSSTNEGLDGLSEQAGPEDS